MMAEFLLRVNGERATVLQIVVECRCSLNLEFCSLKAELPRFWGRTATECRQQQREELGKAGGSQMS